MKKRIVLFMTCLFAVIGLAIAQTRVQGVVLSQEDNEPIVGASILVKGTTIGTVTDMDGRFTLTGIPSSAKTLVVSYVGMKTEELAIRANMRIMLQSDTEVLEDVIVVAYGTAKKSSFTGSASSVGAQTLEKRAISNATNALEGNTSGVQVTAATGQPGDGASIRIRGFGSVNASNAPLYVVDGAVFNGNISDINPADIESLTVLKDAASTSLYGASAGNGVVLITTKSGQASTNGAVGVNLTINQGWSNRAYKDYATMGIDDYYVTTWHKIKNAQITGGKSEADAAAYASKNLVDNFLQYNIFKGLANDAVVDVNGKLGNYSGYKWGEDLDWEDSMFKTGHRQEYILSYNTKTDKSDTYASVGYLKDNGYMIKTDFERYTGRINYNVSPTKWLKTGLNLGFTRTNSSYSNATSDSSSSYSNLQMFARSIAPYMPIHRHDPETGAYLDDDGNVTTDSSKYAYGYYDRLVGTYVGRDGMVEQLWNDRNFHRMNESGKAYVTITPIDGLSFTVNYSLNNLDYRAKRYENPYVGDGTAGPARLSITSYRDLTQTFNQIAQYNKSFDRHTVDVTLGHENHSWKREYIYSMKTGETIHGIYDFENFVNISEVTSSTDEYTKEGFFGRVNYDYDNKYYASLSYRHDGSSRFSKDNRWGDFWSFGLSWRLTQENFMKDIEWINNLKIRASYGQTGNDQGIGYYPYQTLYELGKNNGTEAGMYFTSISNPDIMWETQVSTDAAIEFGLWDNKLSGSVEYFRKESKDLLFDVAQAYSTGVSTITKNIGKVSNYGVEINLDYRIIQSRDWNLSVGANATFLKNELKTLPDDMKENGYVNGSKKWMEGKSMYEFWLYQWQGVDPQTGNGYYLIDDGANVPEADKLTVNGKDYTTSVTYAKKDWAGRSIPKVYGGFNFNLGYKNVSLSATFSYQLGGKILDSSYARLMTPGEYAAAMHEDMGKAWMKPGDISDVPRLDGNATYSQNMVNNNCTRWLISSDYLNLRSVNLSYQLPKSLLSKVQIKNARLNLTCENVFMIKARQGLNPMANFSGLTYNEYMPSRNYTIGLNVGF